MDWSQMYVIGCSITGIVSIIAFIWGFKVMEEQVDAEWEKEWKERIENIRRQTQNIRG